MKKYILAFETTGENASVALIDEEGNVTEEKSERVLNHLQSLMPMTESLMGKKRVEIGDIFCVAASSGPGSFTGIRIGVTTARAFAQAAGIQCIAAPTLQSFTYNIDITNYGGLVCPILDARRDQVYAAVFRYDPGSGGVIEPVAGNAYFLGDYLELLKREAGGTKVSDMIFFGDGVKKYQDEIIKWQSSKDVDEMRIRVKFADSANRTQTAASVAKLALDLYRKGRQTDFNELLPAYMRKAEAERKLEAAAGIFSVRPAYKNDVKQIAALEKICFSLPWSEKSFFEEITVNKIARYTVAETAGNIVGYAGIWLVAGEGHITNVAVHPEFRRKGIAKALISSLIEISEREGVNTYTLEVRASNSEAISLYRGLDFKECGIRREYYEDNNEDAVIMWKR